MKSFRALVLGLITAATLAQGAIAQELTAGARAGINSSDLSNSLLAFSPKIGFNVGVFVGWTFAGGFALAPELFYTTKGTDSQLTIPQGIDDDGNFLLETTDFEATLGYVELQLPLTYGASEISGRLRPRLYAGPSIAYEVSCTTNQVVDGNSVEAECDEVIQVDGETRKAFIDTNKLDFGIVFGAGFNLEMGKGALTGDVRYDFGLTNINSERGGDLSIENRSLVFLIGYAFRLGN